MKATIRIVLTVFALSFLFGAPARADAVDVNVTCPVSVQANTRLTVDVTLSSKETKFIKSIGVGLVANRDNSLGALGIFGPKKRNVNETVSNGNPVELTDVKVRRVSENLIGDIATVVVTPLNDDGNLLGYGVCQVDVVSNP